jgi:Flp pilus assembly pilin Flp
VESSIGFAPTRWSLNGWDREGNIMKRFLATLGTLLRDESGTETLEWGLVCGLIVVGAIAAIGFIGPKVTSMWNNINNKIPNATP